MMADQQIKHIHAARFVIVRPVDARLGKSGRRLAPVAAFVFVPGTAKFIIRRLQLTDGSVVGVEKARGEQGYRQQEK